MIQFSTFHLKQKDKYFGKHWKQRGLETRKTKRKWRWWHSESRVFVLFCFVLLQFQASVLYLWVCLAGRRPVTNGSKSWSNRVSFPSSYGLGHWLLRGVRSLVLMSTFAKSSLDVCTWEYLLVTLTLNRLKNYPVCPHINVPRVPTVRPSRANQQLKKKKKNQNVGNF